MITSAMRASKSPRVLSSTALPAHPEQSPAAERLEGGRGTPGGGALPQCVYRCGVATLIRPVPGGVWAGAAPRPNRGGVLPLASLPSLGGSAAALWGRGGTGPAVVAGLV